MHLLSRKIALFSEDFYSIWMLASCLSKPPGSLFTDEWKGGYGNWFAFLMVQNIRSRKCIFKVINEVKQSSNLWNFEISFMFLNLQLLTVKGNSQWIIHLIYKILQCASLDHKYQWASWSFSASPPNMHNSILAYLKKAKWWKVFHGKTTLWIFDT